MITVEIDGARVPIIKIRRYELNNGIDIWGGYKITLNVEYITEEAEHKVVLTAQHALDVFNSLKEAHKKQAELINIEDAINHLLYDLRELEKTKLEKLNAYGSLLIARKDLLNI